MIIPLHGINKGINISDSYISGPSMQAAQVIQGAVFVQWNSGHLFNGSFNQQRDVLDALEILLCDYLLKNFAGQYEWSDRRFSILYVNALLHYAYLSVAFKDTTMQDFYIEVIIKW